MCGIYSDERVLGAVLCDDRGAPPHPHSEQGSLIRIHQLSGFSFFFWIFI
jgi:hypothetical protein